MTVTPVELGGFSFDENYVKPLNYKVIIRTNDGTETLHTYNGFTPDTNSVRLTALDVKRGMESTGSFDLVLNDPEHNIDRDKVDAGVNVIIQAGKTEASLRNIMYGICYQFRGTRTRNDLDWIISGKGSASILQHTLVNFTRNAPTETLSSGSQIFKKDPNFKAYLLFKEVFESPNVLVSRRSINDTLAARGNFTLNSISDRITEIIPSLRFPMTAAAAVLDDIAQTVGAQWCIDENNDVNFYSPESRSSSVVIKDTVEDSDSGDFTAYVAGDTFAFTSSIDPSDGFANVLNGVSDLSAVVAGQPGALGFESLAFKDLAAMIVPGINMFKDMTFVLSKVGAGTDATNPVKANVRGFIVKDEPGDDGVSPQDTSHKPSGDMVASFRIPITDITETPAPISKINLKLIPGIRIEPNAFYWIVMQEIGDGDDNTIRWHHDGDLETNTSFVEHKIRWAGVRYLPEGRSKGDSYSYRRWITRSAGPVFSHAFIASSKVAAQARDPLSIARWTKGHPVEARLDEGWITNVVTMSQYLNTVVHASAMLPVNFDTVTTTIPNVLYQPGFSIQVADELLGFPAQRNFMAQVVEDHYWADASDYGPGNLVCEVTLKGFIPAMDFVTDFNDPFF
jgi:hypothetical protein